MARPERLTVWLHDLPVAEIERGRRGRIRLSYTDVAYGRFPLNTPILSCAVPLSHTPQDAAAFIDGVLPEGDHRRLLAERARIPAHDSFGLIARYGRDIAGAAQFLPDGADLRTSKDWALEELDARQLGQVVADLPANPLAIVDESELSLAGLQNKMLLVRLGDDGWGAPAARPAIDARPQTRQRPSHRHRRCRTRWTGARPLRGIDRRRGMGRKVRRLRLPDRPTLRPNRRRRGGHRPHSPGRHLPSPRASGHEQVRDAPRAAAQPSLRSPAYSTSTPPIRSDSWIDARPSPLSLSSSETPTAMARTSHSSTMSMATSDWPRSTTRSRPCSGPRSAPSLRWLSAEQSPPGE